MDNECKKLLDEIPADVELVITDALIRAFRIHDCDPTCNCCGVKIEDGMVFKLAYVKTLGHWFLQTKKEAYSGQEPEDEMLCQNCTVEDLIKYKEKVWKKSGNDYWKKLHRGYTRKHVTPS